MSTKKKIRILQGDLTEQSVDAVVNAANNDLQLGGGVAGAIRRKAGMVIQDECDQIGTIPVGEAAITGAGALKARYVIHAASMSLGRPTTEENLRLSTRNSLLRAREKGLRSIAFPAVGTGVAGFPVRRCAEVMLEEVVAHLQGATSLESVRFVLYDASAYQVFRDVYEALPE
jgi:O-acetyl-ADP-ribose deacetylase (regulator of RNase III)